MQAAGRFDRFADLAIGWTNQISGLDFFLLKSGKLSKAIGRLCQKQFIDELFAPKPILNCCQSIDGNRQQSIAFCSVTHPSKLGTGIMPYNAVIWQAKCHTLCWLAHHPNFFALRGAPANLTIFSLSLSDLMQFASNLRGVTGRSPSKPISSHFLRFNYPLEFNSLFTVQTKQLN